MMLQLKKNNDLQDLLKNLRDKKNRKKNMSIECIRYTSANKGTFLGFADFYIPKMGIEIYGCTLHQKDGRRWINFPSKEFVDELGEKKYAPLLRFHDKTHMEPFTKQALDAIDKKCAELNVTQECNEGLPF